MMRIWGAAAVAAVVVLSVAGCGGPQKDASYGSVADLKSSVEQVTGEKCTDGLGSSSMQKYSWDSGQCGPDDTIAVYADAGRQSDVETRTRGANPSWFWVSGKLWSFSSPDKGRAAKVQDAMGGTLH